MNESAIPSKQQQQWQDLELGMFCHFGLNTQEWGDGTDSMDKFNPVELDARQWARVAKSAGFKYLILTAKHHDGFCLWQTQTTEYSVKSSPWKGGSGDVVAECADACRKEGILFGLYLSPWDRHEPCYINKSEYDDFYARQLTELLTGYGPLVEIWFDGAGSEGRQYDWERYIALVNKYQPDAMIFNMGKPNIRWVGNEEGTAPYPCWNSTLESTPKWLPAECDVPIHKGHWFWHPDDDNTLLSLEKLMELYSTSVGHGANLLLNVAPDDHGLLSDADVKRVQEFGSSISLNFSNPLIEASGSGNVLELEFGSIKIIDRAVLMEDITFGERVYRYIIEAYSNDKWIDVINGISIGHKKIDFFKPVFTHRIRLRILESKGVAHIRRFAVYSKI